MAFNQRYLYLMLNNIFHYGAVFMLWNSNASILDADFPWRQIV